MKTWVTTPLILFAFTVTPAVGQFRTSDCREPLVGGAVARVISDGGGTFDLSANARMPVSPSWYAPSPTGVHSRYFAARVDAGTVAWDDRRYDVDGSITGVDRVRMSRASISLVHVTCHPRSVTLAIGGGPGVYYFNPAGAERGLGRVGLHLGIGLAIPVGERGAITSEASLHAARGGRRTWLDEMVAVAQVGIGFAIRLRPR